MTSTSYPFDPTYGYTLEELLRIEAPEEPADFAGFWQKAYDESMQVAPRPELRDSGKDVAAWRIFDLRYQSTDGMIIGGWLIAPVDGVVRRGVVVGHGYGGRDAPDLDFPLEEAVMLFPCFRGLSRSMRHPISPEARWHVLHEIDKPEHYIHRGCVQDLWLAVSALLRLFPQTRGHIAYMGISFGGGIGALALPWDSRMQCAHFNVPSLGNYPLRLQLPTLGSAASIQELRKRTGTDVLKTLRYYDAASAATHIKVPVHCACAIFDPFVAPPGQFSIYNALSGLKELSVLNAGHSEYPLKTRQEKELKKSLIRFFANL